MAWKLSQASKDTLDAKHVMTYEYIEINGAELPKEHILSYEYGMDRNFGAAKFVVNLINDSGTYDSLKFNDEVIFKEGLYGFDNSLETINKFHGLIRQTDFQRLNNGTRVTVVTALDYICRLEDLDYEAKHEATKFYVADEILVPATGQDTAQCRVFDSENTNWASSPIPYLKIVDKTDDSQDAKWDGFEVNYQGGQIILSLGLNVEDNYDLVATYAYYKKGIYLENILKSIITTTDGYGNAVFGENTNLKEWYIGDRGSVGDDDINRKTTLSVATSGGEASITVADTSNFDSSGKAYFDNDDGTYDEFTYTGKDSTHFTGCSGIDAHAQGTEIIQVRDYLIPNYIPATIDRKAVLDGDINSSTTTIPVKPETNSMLPNSDASRRDVDKLKYYDLMGGGYSRGDNNVNFIGDGITSVWGLYHRGNLSKNLKVNGRYLLSIYAKYSGAIPAQGLLNVDFYGTGVDTSGLQVSCSTLTLDYVKYTSSNFTLSSIPSDIICRIFVDGTLTNGSTVHVGKWILEEVEDDTITTASSFWKMWGMDSSGYIKINDEYIYYADRNENSFNNCIRAQLGSSAADHDGNSLITQAYPAGQLWYLSYNNHITDLVPSNFYFSSGTIDSIDKKYGFVKLTSAISTSASAYCKKNYQFYTIQATGIEIGSLNFTYKDTNSRFDAIQNIRELIAPNYLLMTKGTGKIWGQYLQQKSVEDFELQLITSMSHAQDTDIYTRVRMWGKNINPENLLVSDTAITIHNEGTYSGTASDVELAFVEVEGDWYKYKSSLGEVAIVPGSESVKVNGVLINGQSVNIPQGDVLVDQGEWVITEGNNVTIDYDTYVIFSHAGIDSNYDIYIYDSSGTLKVHLSPNDPNVNYAEGYWKVPGTEANQTLVAEYTASDNLRCYNSYPSYYNIEDTLGQFISEGFEIHQLITVCLTLYYPSDWPITYQEFHMGYFWINSITSNWLELSPDTKDDILYDVNPDIMPYDYQITIKGYWAGIRGLSNATYNVIYYPEYLWIDYENGYFYIHDYLLDASEFREDMITATFSYSEATNQVISAETLAYATDGNPDTQLQIVYAAEPVQGTPLFTLEFSEEKNIDAIDITAGYFLPAAYDADENDPRRYGCTNYFSFMYSNDGTNYYYISENTTYFRLESGEGAQFDSDVIGEDFSCKYIKVILEKSDKIDYTEEGIWCVAIQDLAIYKDVTLKTEAKLVADQADVTESPPTIYDSDDLLNTVGDRIWKDTNVNEDLNTQEKLDKRAKDYLIEFYKNHTKASIDVVYDPRPMIGDTVKTIDHQGASTNYFVESISRRSGSNLQLSLARYP